MKKRIVMLLLTAGLCGCPGPGQEPTDLGGTEDLGTGDLGPPPSPDSGPGPDGSGGPGPQFERYAGMVQAVAWLMPYGTHNEVQAAFFKGVPEGFHKEALRIGDCRLLTFRPALCDSGCAGVCVDRNVCRPFPQRISAGIVSLEGLVKPISMRPQYENHYTLEEPIRGDLFAGMRPVWARASGGDFPAFLVSTQPVATFQTNTIVRDEIRLLDEEDFVFSWQPGPEPTARVRLVLNANNRGHGLPYEGIIECDAADRGRLVIDRRIIAAFPDTFRWEICAGRDCPLSEVMRYRVATVDTVGGKAALLVGSGRKFWVLHRPPR